MTDFNPNNPYNAPQICDFVIKNIYFGVPLDEEIGGDFELFEQLRDVMPQYYKLQYIANMHIFGLGAPQNADYNVAWYTIDSAGQRTLHWSTLEEFTFDVPVYADVAP